VRNMSCAPEVVDPGAMEQPELNDGDDVASDAPNAAAIPDPLGRSQLEAGTDHELERELDRWSDTEPLDKVVSTILGQTNNLFVVEALFW
jgi:hypothetical protein